MLFLVGKSLQQIDHRSALEVGLAILPQGVAVGVFSILVAGRMSRPGRWVAAGLALLLAGHVLYTTVLDGNYAAHLLPACLLVGAGIAAIYPPATLMVSAAAPPNQQATAAGLLTTSQQAGSAIGVAVVTAVTTSTGSAPPGLWSAVVVVAATTAAVAGLLYRRIPEAA